MNSKARKPKAKTLRKSAHAAKRRTAFKPKPEELLQAWEALPFVRVVEGPRKDGWFPENIDYWAIPEEPSVLLGAEFLGDYYALLAIRHAFEQHPSLPLLSYILNDMIKQGRPLWPSGDSDAPMNGVAAGFVGTLAKMAMRADGWGVLSQYAMSYGTQLIGAANSKERMSRDIRKALREHGERLIEFARTPIVKGRRHPPAAGSQSEIRDI